MSDALTNLVETVTTGRPRAAENVLNLHVDETLFDKVRRRERTLALRPANKYWNDHLKGIQYTHIKLTTQSGRSLRVAFKGVAKHNILIAPDKRAVFWEVTL